MRPPPFLEKAFWRHRLASSVFMVTLALAAASAYYSHLAFERAEIGEFEAEALAATHAISQRLTAYVNALEAGEGLFAASVYVSRDEFRVFVDRLDLQGLYPGIQGYGFSRRLDGSEAALRDTAGLTPRPPRPGRNHAVVFLSPLTDRNRLSLGIDLSEDPVRREAMERARDTGKPAATGLTFPMQGNEDDRLGFIIFKPVYRNGAPIAYTEQRRRALQGFLYAKIIGKDLLTGVLGKAGHKLSMDAYLGDFASGDLLYSSREEAAAPLWGLQLDESVTFADKTLKLRFIPLPGLRLPFHAILPAGILATGAALALVFFVLLRRLDRTGELLRQSNIGLESRVAERTRELEAANAELATFSYSVSHDLRAPLRSIHGFASAILERSGGSPDASDAQDSRRILASAERMSHIIDGLLLLLQISRAELNREEVDVTAMAREIAEEARLREPSRTVKVSVAEGLRVRAVAEFIQIILENLLVNAFKFTSRRPDAEIEVGQTQADGRKAFFVRDNGAGFDMAYAGKLFTPFQRLHERADFPGIGIGLATVRRAVERHGGTVWAEGEPGAGATFYFTIPEGPA